MRNFLRRYGVWVLVILIGVFIVGLITASPIEQPAFLAQEHGRPLIIAHKGGEGLAPGNTLEAFQRGLDEGADILETDARLTADGHVVLFHDETVDALTDGTGAVEELSLSELKALDAGYRWTPDEGQTYPFRGQGLQVITLEEALQAFPEARFNIDMKTHNADMVEAMVRVISANQATDRVLVASFDGDTARAFRDKMPSVPSSLASDEVKTFFTLQLLRLSGAYTPPVAAAQVPEYQGSLHVVSAHFVEAAHDRGVQVHVWTINDEAIMRKLLKLGVDGIVTDYPNLLREVIQDMGG